MRRRNFISLIAIFSIIFGVLNIDVVVQAACPGTTTGQEGTSGAPLVNAVGGCTAAEPWDGKGGNDFLTNSSTGILAAFYGFFAAVGNASSNNTLVNQNSAYTGNIVGNYADSGS